MATPSNIPPPFQNCSHDNESYYNCMGSAVESFIYLGGIAKTIFSECFNNLQEQSPEKKSPLEQRLDEVKARTFNPTPPSAEYSKIRKKIQKAKNASEIFENPLNSSECKKKYRQMTLHVHPDKNPGNELEASLLFHCVQEAFNELETKSQEPF